MKKYSLLLGIIMLVILMLSFNSCGFDEVATELAYELNEDGQSYTVVGIGGCKDQYITIPAYHKNKPVTAIGDYAFQYRTIKGVKIPITVETIGDYAFHNCLAFEKLEIAENGNLKTIGMYAFANTGNLFLNLYIPEGVTEIKDRAFLGCWFTKISIPNSLEKVGEGAFSIYTDAYINSPAYSYYDGAIYIGNESNPHLLLCDLPSSYVKVCSINENTKIIGSYAFSYCSNIEKIIVPDSVTSIGEGAFKNCSSLKTLILPDSLTIIPNEMVAYCSKLKDFTIPLLVTSIGSEAFRDTALTSFYIPSSVNYIGEGAFRNCDELIMVSARDNSELKCIEARTFLDCSNLTDIIIPKSVSSIGLYAFRNCTSLTAVEIPDAVTSIGYGAFDQCSALENVVFRENSQLESIGGFAFNQCEKIASFDIPDTVTSIGEFAFQGCDSITSIVFPDSVTELGASVFNHNWGLKEVKLGVGCTSLKSTVDEDNNTNIWGAFDNNLSLETVTIYNSMTEFDAETFRNCASLKTINFIGTIEEWEAIKKGKNWDAGTGDYTVYCTNGSIAKDGTITHK